MAEKNKDVHSISPEEMLLALDGIYYEIENKISAAKASVQTEVKYTTVQSQSLEKELSAKIDEQAAAIKALRNELMYSLQQTQAVHSDLSDTIKDEVAQKLSPLQEQSATLNEVAERLQKIDGRIGDVDPVAIANEVLDGIPQPEAIDYSRIIEQISERIEVLLYEGGDGALGAPRKAEIDSEKLVADVSDKVLDLMQAQSIGAVDYEKIVEETTASVCDRVLEMLQEQPTAEVDVERIVYETAEKVVESLPPVEKVDYEKLTDLIAEKTVPTEIDVEELSNKVAEKVAPAEVNYEELSTMVAEKIPATEIDYDMLSDLVAGKVPVPEIDYEGLSEMVAGKVTVPETDYDKLSEMVASKVPVPEIDYEALSDMVASKVVVPETDYEMLSDLVAGKMPVPETDYEGLAVLVAGKVAPTEIDYDKLSDMVASRVAPPEIDYDKLADMVASRVAPPAVDYDALAAIVVAKIAEKEETTEVFIDSDGMQDIADTVSTSVASKLAETLKVDNIDYDRVCQAAQAAQIVPDPIDYDRIADVVAAQITPETVDYDKIADVVIERFSAETFTFEEVAEETPVEEAAVAEEPAVEPVAEEPVAEEAPVEETVEAAPVEVNVAVEVAPAAQDELAAAEVVTEAPVMPTLGLVEADGDLVLRLKRSFTAKLKQSEDDIKTYYSVLKNALCEYKRINSNISWHGDRFNFGRDTVARVTIIGKTLGLYLALDPEDPEFKQTVYRQKDVSKQKAYDGTPFMVKIKSDGGLKKALRLVAALAERLGTEKDSAYEEVDYIAMYPNATDEEMLAEGLIKATKEKKVALDF